MESKISNSIIFKDFENLKMYHPEGGVWYVGYSLVLEDGTKVRRKERGKKQYKISLAKVDNEKDRKGKLKLLFDSVEYDLRNGIDPANSDYERKKREWEALKKAEASKISIDKAIQIIKENRGWVNPTYGNKTTAVLLLAFYNHTFKRFLIEIKKDDNVLSVTKKDLNDWIEKEFNPTEGKKGWSALTCKLNLSRVSILFKTLIQRDYLDFNPCSNIILKKDSEKIVPIKKTEIYESWTQQEINIWFAELFESGSKADRILHVCSAIIYYTFIRRSEMLRLKIWMIEFPNQRFTLPPHITKSARRYENDNLIHVDIPKSLIEILKEWLSFAYPNGYNDDDFLIPKNNNPKLSYSYRYLCNSFDSIKGQLIEKYKGDNLFVGKNFYALKHTGVQKLFNTLVNTNWMPMQIQAYIMQQCRHATFSQTEVYLRKLKLEFKVERKIVDF
ncbi:MAG: site-specific integrase [Pedobacter sp.]|uniref:tyrosine-type recombinase/integrase n=1 Tax=Pedobacter sp. TaxID=1411316 RepID=UPI003564FFB9